MILVDDLLSSGYSYREIASVLGRSYESVRGMVKRMRKGSGNEGRGESLGGKRRLGLLDLSFEDVLVLLGNRSKDNVGSGGTKMRKESLEKHLNGPRRNVYTMSDYEATMVIERYLKRTGNIEGARNLWNHHLKYKGIREGQDYDSF